MDFERNLHEKMQILSPLTKAGVLEMLFRLQKEEKVKIGDFSRKYRMHSETAKQASEILFEFKLIVFLKEGRKKYLVLTDKGRKILERFLQLYYDLK